VPSVCPIRKYRSRMESILFCSQLYSYSIHKSLTNIILYLVRNPACAFQSTTSTISPPLQPHNIISRRTQVQTFGQTRTDLGTIRYRNTEVRQGYNISLLTRVISARTAYALLSPRRLPRSSPGRTWRALEKSTGCIR
jgi:hypothetical protein